MRHAGEGALDRLDSLLREVRRRHPELRERKPGAFYRGGQGWLHFHEDPAGLFADVKIGSAWKRFPIDTAGERKLLLDRLSESLTPVCIDGVTARSPVDPRRG